MTKSKWLKLVSTMPIKTITEAVRANPYTEKTGNGFELTYFDKGRLQCRFIEKKYDREEIRDPFGNVNLVEVIRYTSITAAIYTGMSSGEKKLLIEIYSPPRSIRTLMHELDAILGGITISEFELDPFSVFQALRARSRRARMTKIKASQLRVSEDSEMKIEISSFSDAYKDFKSTFPKSNALVDRIRIENAFNDMAGNLEISKSAVFAFDESIEDTSRAFLLDYFRSQN